MKKEKTMNMLGNWEDFLPNETIELAKKLYKKRNRKETMVNFYIRLRISYSVPLTESIRRM